MPDQVFVQVAFEAQHPKHGTYRDALFFALEDYLALTPAKLDAAKTERLNAWVDAIENPPVPEPVPEATARELATQAVADAAAALAAAQEALRAADEAAGDGG